MARKPTRKPKASKPAKVPARRSRQIRPDAEREEAFRVWAETRNIKAAARITGTPEATIRSWIDDPREAERVARIRADHARARNARTRRAILKRHRDVVADTEDARTTLAKGRGGRATAVQVQAARETFVALATLDKVTRLDDGQVTERVGLEVGGAAVDALNAILGELKR